MCKPGSNISKMQFLLVICDSLYHFHNFDPVGKLTIETLEQVVKHVQS